MAIRLPVLVSALALAGCIVPVEFDPVGEAASVQGSWTIAGVAPTTESCVAAEVSFVRVRFFEGDGHRDHAGLVFECALGSFDTRPEHVVAAGSWELAPIAIRADGSEVAAGPHQMADTGASDHIVLATFDIPGGSG